ncbi:hypothetical protein J6590_030393 [Homalodisca vitripennis]|nr:hypothetical protein J6590_030393 [Homalodisca vitripennis]
MEDKQSAGSMCLGAAPSEGGWKWASDVTGGGQGRAGGQAVGGIDVSRRRAVRGWVEVG